MNFQVLFITLFLSCSLAQNQDVTTEANDRVAGGAAAGSVPYQVSLRNIYVSHFCAGAIISDRWILTSAYCLTIDHPYTVQVGTNLLGINSEFLLGESFETKLVVKHDKYNPYTKANDIGMIQTELAIVFKSNIQAIKLPTANLPDESFLLATGWGYKTYDNQATLVNKLQTLPMRIYNQNSCYNTYFNVRIDYSMLCTKTKNGQGICEGDLGGPLVDSGYLYGIMSFSRGCGDNNPIVSTRVSSFIPWIKFIQAIE